jgi:peptidoglycan hydrolase CwlO-like protein
MHHGKKIFAKSIYLLIFIFHRIRGLVKVKALHEQVASMEKIVGQMKVNKEQVHKQVQQLRQRIDQLINEITVSLCYLIYLTFLK